MEKIKFNRKILGIVLCVLLTTIVIPVSGLKIGHGNQKGTSDIETIALPHGRAMVKLIQQLDETMVKGYIENLTAFGPRVTGTIGCEQAANYIYNEFKKMGLEVRYQNWTSGAIHGTNVEATLNGVDSSSNDIYVICGHYDGVPESPAADDNGAGTAAVMSAAKVMNQYKFGHTIRFVAFSGEEQGMLGSYAYAEEAHRNKDNIIASLNIDMTGHAKSEDSGSIIEIFENRASSWITNVAIKISKYYREFINLEVSSVRLNIAVSDHYSLCQFGYDSVFFYESKDNPNFHTPNDTMENMNITYATKVAKLTIATLAELSSIAFTIKGNTLYVGGSGSGNYSNIRDAIENATINDIVFVFNGTYSEHINIDNPIDLIGENKEKTFIIGNETENVVYVSSSWVYITGFTIKNIGTKSYSAGMNIYSDRNIISENIISNDNGYGIGVWGKSYNNISNNIITDNKDGIIFWYASVDNLISDNVIKNNEVSGVTLSGGSNGNIISHNIIENNSFGIYFQGNYDSSVNSHPFHNIISKNTITKNKYGIYLVIASKENMICNNNITYNEQGIFIGNSCNSNTIKKNNFMENNRHAYFKSCFMNRWIGNYWDNQKIKLRPKVIVGNMGVIPWIPSFQWINIDLFPARKPYKI
ncbi:MAG: M28 family peptidase [Euryarchaeota archaeon]|nr:M28 family peptidase [Euryarchaeota archaeon]